MKRMHESKVTQEQPSSIKISMHLVWVILNSTIKWAGPCTRSYRSMETPPELVVLSENIVKQHQSMPGPHGALVCPTRERKLPSSA